MVVLCREEYVGSELDKTFQPSHQKPADGELTQYSILEDDEAVPSHLEVLISTLCPIN